jgi:hypothetical protein
MLAMWTTLFGGMRWGWRSVVDILRERGESSEENVVREREKERRREGGKEGRRER